MLPLLARAWINRSLVTSTGTSTRCSPEATSMPWSASTGRPSDPGVRSETRVDGPVVFDVDEQRGADQ